MRVGGGFRARCGRTGRAARWAAAGTAITLAAGGAAWGLGATAGRGTRIHGSDQRITVIDGPDDDQRVTLDATFYRPSGRARVPAILLGHGFGGSKRDVADEARRLARAGYAVLTWSARGFGRSTGEIALNSPDYEVKDTRQLIDWLGRRPDVRLDGPGDPRLGMAGGSYGGAIALLTAAYDRRVDAIAPMITWHSLADALFPNAVDTPNAAGTAVGTPNAVGAPDAAGAGPSGGVFKKLWAGLFFTGNAGRTACGRFLPSLCAMYQEVAERGRPTASAIETLRRSSPSSVADRIKVPTLLVQGQSDSLFPLDHADANARAIAGNGAPVSVVWFRGGHDGGDPETERIEGLVLDFFDARLKRSDTASHGDGFTVTREGGLDSSTREVIVEEAATRTYPGLSRDPVQLPLGGGQQTIYNPPGGSPASISALPGLGSLAPGGAAGALGVLGGRFPAEQPGQFAVFDTRPLEQAVQLTGAASARLKVDADGPLFAKLYDVAPSGTATLARRLAAPFRVSRGQDVTVTLPAMDYRFDRGHRIRLVVATTDLGFATPAKPASYKVRAVSPLAVPTVPSLTTEPTGVPAWVWGLPLAAAALALLIVVPGRRRPAPEQDSDVPLEITGLTKAYKNGHLAVADLSFRVEKGQVLGLLGPNGAGKTTTLRMLMGLIHPDSGEMRIFGHRVYPGAPVLSRLGSFVEGPGFLPHLSGRDNLDLYWRATGRPLDEAHLDEALQIADLGSALDRPVRTYSQGMRQRLAIAQAMLGLPDLLVLDEPTNGLDPPQIREMREVLVRYAAAGRTVIVSSHLLAEVEQTCTHAVVMAGGRRVAAGPVAEITGSGRRLEDAFLEIIGETP
ncbi:alpha/beta fold hydrolase [Actinomadura sp. 9N215]|uniref:alpha/beta fold hydrolase n=1 Tax=Actinomadura sp. 9N215 TaxID=3375150 RepID=UPI00379CCB8D